SPETAQLIALQSLVLAGKVDVMEAARMNVATTGGDTALLDCISGRAATPSRTPQVVSIAPPIADEDAPDNHDADDDDAEAVPMPTGRYNAKRLTARLEATR